MRRVFQLMSIVGIVLAAGSLAAQEADPAAIEVVGVSLYDDVLSGPASTGTFLSPDGTRFLNVTGGQDEPFCIYETFGDRIGCIAFDGSNRYNPSSFQWSPDGRYIAFHDGDPLRYFDDSDIWLIDTTVGTVTNLTEDGELRSVFDRFLDDSVTGPLAPADASPRFSADSQSILFVRYDAADDALTSSLYQVPVSGGDPVLAARLIGNHGKDGFATVWDLAPDGESAVYVRSSASEESLWSVDLATGDQERLHVIDRELELGALTLDFSPRSDAVLWHSAMLMTYGQRNDLNYVYVTTLDGDTFPATADLGARAAGWSPDGSAIVYSVIDFLDEERTGLHVSAVGEAGRLILSPVTLDQNSGFFSPIYPAGLQWAQNNAVLVTMQGGSPLFALQLGTN
jgi:dipeptidyl aminopeptidase/acylaminoacyl peptidase